MIDGFLHKSYADFPSEKVATQCSVKGCSETQGVDLLESSAQQPLFNCRQPAAAVCRHTLDVKYRPKFHEVRSERIMRWLLSQYAEPLSYSSKNLVGEATSPGNLSRNLSRNISRLPQSDNPFKQKK